MFFAVKSWLIDWSKHQNNFSKIFPDEHLLDWSSSALLDSFSSKISASQIWSSGCFEERLFPEALLSLFLSGGMIFISHLLRSVYFFISQSALHCIICLDHFNFILRHIIGDIEWPLIFRSFYVSICCTVIKILLIYITRIRISSYKYQHLQQNIFAQFESLNKIVIFHISIFSLYQIIWAINTWWIKYDTKHKTQMHIIFYILPKGSEKQRFLY